MLLNDEMDDVLSKIGVTNRHGLVQGEANAIAPGKRYFGANEPRRNTGLAAGYRVTPSP